MIHEFELPWPPSVNHYYRHVGCRVLISRDGRAYRAKVAAIALALGRPRFEGDIALKAEFWPPDNRRRDLDNVGCKVMQDSLQAAGFFKDDSQIKRLNLAMYRETVPGGRCLVRLESL